MNYTKAPVAIIDAHCLRAFESVLAGARYLKHLVVVNGDAGRHVSYDRLIAESSPQLDCAPTDKDDPAVWLFTSGSTGKPKAAVHAHFHFPYNTECYAKRVVGYDESFVTISVPRLFFGYATGTNLMFPFAVGGSTCLFADHPTPERMIDMIGRFKPNFLTTVPTMINKMLGWLEERGLHSGAGVPPASGFSPAAPMKSEAQSALGPKMDPGFRRDDGKEASAGGTLAPQSEAQLAALRGIKRGVTAGEALPAALYEKWIAATGVELLDGIGSAESFHIYISNYPGDVRIGSLGKIVPGYEARVCDDDGRELPDGEIGTLHVSGDSAALMYWSDYEKSTRVLKGGSIVSGDKFRRDGQGYYYYMGRADDLLKVGGIWVAPQEIENCLLTHPSVAEACVTGVEDAQGLTLPKAYVVLKESARRAPGDALVTQLQDYVKEKLARYKYPRTVEFRDSLPKNDRGKIDRKALKG